jgi:hypothetical protein
MGVVAKPAMFHHIGNVDKHLKPTDHCGRLLEKEKKEKSV